MGEFGGWDMPIQYSGILSEVAAVRNQSGVFDVSHMGQTHFTGKDAKAFLEKVTVADIDARTY